MCNVYIKDVSSKMKSLIECVGLCNADSTKCNSVFFMKQNLICKLANLLSYKVSNTNKAMSGELAYIQTSKLQEKNYAIIIIPLLSGVQISHDLFVFIWKTKSVFF
jgi:hypothetical protein